MDGASLRESFVGALTADSRAEGSDVGGADRVDHVDHVADLDAVLEGWVREADRAWPGLSVAPARFVAHVAARLGKGALREGVAQDRVSDLYLAFGCSEGDERALAYFDAHLIPEIIKVWKTSRDPAMSLDDAKQMLRCKLLMASPGERPRIATNSGAGKLRTWVRVSAARLLADVPARSAHEEPRDETFFHALAVDGVHPELEHLKATYGNEFRRAFSDATSALSFRTRNVLRYALVDGLTVDKLGEVYGVSRSTAARWLTAAREALYAELERQLRARLGLSATEYQSVLRLIASRVDVSVERCLA
jgi:RNA polymerase sigma-70 factor (ECF subfamily)